MEQHLVVVYFHEIALKGRNRRWFSQRMKGNLLRALAGTGARMTWDSQALAVFALDEADTDEVQRRLSHTPGVEKYYIAYQFPWDLDAVEAALGDLLPSRAFGSFRLSARRNDKRFPLTSAAINQRLGAHVKALTGARVDLSHPELEISVYVLPGHIYVYMDEHPGPSGMPVGVGGTVMALLSGGIDSPVAAWRLLRRGCRVELVHFHSFPLLAGTSREKTEELAQTLARWQLRSILHQVPFAKTQQRLLLAVPPDYRVIAYRRFMLRIAERLARRRNAGALVTGESLGQVSSQTLENIQVVGAVAAMPILRPLIGMDKAEIVAQARRIGTYETSIIPDEDCCTLFSGRHPATRAKVEMAERFEAELDVDALVDEAVEGTEVREYTWPG